MYVCVCRAVTDKQIVSAVRDGARRLRDLRVQLGVTEECGRCAQCAKQCLDGAVEKLATPPALTQIQTPLRPVRSPAPYVPIQEAA